jgi:hypothetical protein
MTIILLSTGTQLTGQFSGLFSLSFRIYYNLFPNLYNYNIKSYKITPELAHIKWITIKDEHSTGLRYFRVTNSRYITLTEDIKLCFRTLSDKNKTVNTTVHNKHRYCCNCYMFQPLIFTKGQENIHFSKWEINQRISDFVMYILYTTLTLF